MSVPAYLNPLINITRFGFEAGNIPAIPPQLFVSSTAGMNVGDTIEIMLDNGVLFRTSIAGIPVSGQIVISNSLPYFASAGNIVIDLTANTVVAPSRAELSTDLGG